MLATRIAVIDVNEIVLWGPNSCKRTNENERIVHRFVCVCAFVGQNVSTRQ